MKFVLVTVEGGVADVMTNLTSDEAVVVHVDYDNAEQSAEEAHDMLEGVRAALDCCPMAQQLIAANESLTSICEQHEQREGAGE